MKLLTIDPGSRRSGVVSLAWQPQAIAPPWGLVPASLTGEPGGKIVGDFENHDLLRLVTSYADSIDGLIIETMPTVFGGAAARDQLEAERWAGRFLGVYTVLGHGFAVEVTSSGAKAACGPGCRKDPQVRAAVEAMFGGREAAHGRRCPACKGRKAGCQQCRVDPGWDPPRGPLRGWTGSHVYRAFACALAACRPGGELHTWRAMTEAQRRQLGLAQINPPAGAQ